MVHVIAPTRTYLVVGPLVRQASEVACVPEHTGETIAGCSREIRQGVGGNAITLLVGG